MVRIRPLPANGVVNRVITVDSMEPHPENYNVHSDEQVARIRASIQRFGQVRSVVVQEGAPGRYTIVAGEGTWRGAQEAGETEMRADVIPGNWSETQVLGYLVADNETARLGAPDLQALARVVQRQLAEAQDLASLGLDQNQLADILAALEQPPTLDELGEEFDGEPDPRAFWPVLRLRVPPGVKLRFDSLMKQMPDGASDKSIAKQDREVVRFAALLACVDTASASQLSVAALVALFDAHTGEEDEEGAGGALAWDEDE